MSAMIVFDLSYSAARRVARGAAVGCCLGAVAGCYSYAPVPVAQLTPDMTVRLELSAVAVDRLRTGPDSLARLVDGFKVSGTVSRLQGDSLVLAVPTSYMEANVRLRTQMHDLPILRSEVRRVSSRQLDRKRTTWTSVAVGAIGAAAVVYVLNHGGESTGGNGKPVDPSEIRLIPGR